MTKNEALTLAMDWYGSGNQDPDEFERLILSIVAQPKQDGKCKHCTDGCPACDARKLPEQEPVGYASEGAAERLTTVKQAHEQIRSFKLFTHDVPLYTTPPQRKPLTIEQPKVRTGDCLLVGVCASEGHKIQPQRTWVGLKDKEIEEIWNIAMFTDYGIGAELSNQPFVHYARAIEAKLKEKNT